MHPGDEIDLAIKQYELDMKKKHEDDMRLEGKKRPRRKTLKNNFRSIDVTAKDIKDTKKRHEEISKSQVKKFSEKYK